jgi:hypothetical protein
MSAEASSVAKSQLDLYDFFSVLLPGVYFLITLIPVVPDSLPLGTATAAVVLLVGGYVVGRALHTAAESLDSSPSNRETFINAINSRDDSGGGYLDNETREQLLKLPKGGVAVSIIEAVAEVAMDKYDKNLILNDELKDRFYGVIKQDSQLDLPYERTEADKSEIEALYIYTRSQLYQHGNVRSQSFQAIYAFYRSTFLATQLAVFSYIVYAFGQLGGYWSEAGNYSTLIGGLEIPPAVILVFAEMVLIASLLTLGDAKDDYRKYYIEYLIVDYLTIR